MSGAEVETPSMQALRCSNYQCQYFRPREGVGFFINPAFSSVVDLSRICRSFHLLSISGGHRNWATTVDGIVRTTKEAWISGTGRIVPRLARSRRATITL